MRYEAYKPEWGHITHAPYRREPYVLATLDDGSTRDGKARAWTATRVWVAWYDRDEPSDVVVGIPGRVHSAWFAAEQVQRIERPESSWADAHDIIGDD